MVENGYGRALSVGKRGKAGSYILYYMLKIIADDRECGRV